MMRSLNCTCNVVQNTVQNSICTVPTKSRPAGMLEESSHSMYHKKFTVIIIEFFKETSEPWQHTIEMYVCAIIGQLDLSLWPLTLKTVSAMPTHMINTCRKFHSYLSTKWTDIALCKINVNKRTDNRRTDGRTAEQTTWIHNVSTTYCWRKYKNSFINATTLATD